VGWRTSPRAVSIRNGFGNWFRRQCDAAGLPRCTTHGLRKATLRRMTERLMPNQTMKSVSAHSKDEKLAKSIEAANQELLADGALQGPAEWEMSNLGRRLDAKKR
jgi:hypothetical protein